LDGSAQGLVSAVTPLDRVTFTQTFLVTLLEPLTTYNVSVAASNAAGSSIPSPAALQRTVESDVVWLSGNPRVVCSSPLGLTITWGMPLKGMDGGAGNGNIGFLLGRAGEAMAEVPLGMYSFTGVLPGNQLSVALAYFQVGSSTALPKTQSVKNFTVPVNSSAGYCSANASVIDVTYNSTNDVTWTFQPEAAAWPAMLLNFTRSRPPPVQ
jgi:hypothetical protein